jgi:hypothetical protein
MMIEKRQTKLQANAEAIERWQRKLFRAATELKKLTEQRKRLLYPKASNRKYHPMPPTGMGGNEFPNDDIPL